MKLIRVFTFAWVLPVYVAWWAYVMAISVVVGTWHRLKKLLASDRLRVGQHRVLTAPITGLSAHSVVLGEGSVVTVLGYGEYDGWDVNVRFPDGREVDIGARWLRENSRPL